MFNDLSSPAALLATRRSGKPRYMIAPGPDAAQLERILAAAMRVPTMASWGHGVSSWCRPKSATLSLRYCTAAKDIPQGAKLPQPEDIEQFAHQAPCLIVALFGTENSVQPPSAIPEVAFPDMLC